MRRLGYHRYIAQGGDFGARISLALATVDHEHAAGAHVNFLPTAPSGDPAELDQLSESDLARLQRASRYIQDQSGYMKLQSTRPQTLAYALTDSPAGQLAWIIEKFKEWTGSAKVPEDAVARDRLLTNATIYWLTGTAGSSAQLYYEAAGFLPTAPAPPSLPPLPVPVPLGVAVYPHDILLPIRRLADRDFPNIVRWSEFDRGCPVSPKAANVRLRLQVILHPPAPRWRCAGAPADRSQDRGRCARIGPGRVPGPRGAGEDKLHHLRRARRGGADQPVCHARFVNQPGRLRPERRRRHADPLSG
jgi:hypothetical protein